MKKDSIHNTDEQHINLMLLFNICFPLIDTCKNVYNTSEYSKPHTTFL